jgi:hypothetical protein
MRYIGEKVSFSGRALLPSEISRQYTLKLREAGFPTGRSTAPMALQGNGYSFEELEPAVGIEPTTC